MADVFISYKSDRRPVVEQLARVLEANGYSVWFDHALLAGEEFSEPIERELRAARAVVVLWCSLSVTSHWVREEASLAKRLRTLIPVRIERVELPLGFATLQAVDLTRWDGGARSPCIGRLVQEIARLVGRDPAPATEAPHAAATGQHGGEAEKVVPSGGVLAMQPLARPGTHAETVASDRTAAAVMEATEGQVRSASIDVPASGAGRSGPLVPEEAVALHPWSRRAAAWVTRPGVLLSASAFALGGATAVGAWQIGLALAVVGAASAALRRLRASRQGSGAGAAQSHARPRFGTFRADFPALPEQPSLVVLPFTNLSDDPEQNYFADGITEELTNGLARVRWFFVIARNSAFTFKGQAVDVRRIGQELGVRYVLEGSVRKVANRIRITGRLIEAQSGHHVWSDRFEGSLDEIFELQDSVTEAVIGALEPSLRNAEIERAQHKPHKDLGAYDLYLRALPCYHSMTEAGTTEAMALLHRALKHSPQYALAKSLFAACAVRREAEGWARPGEREEAIRLAREAVATLPGDPTVLSQSALAVAYLAYAHDEAAMLIERALVLSPHSALVEGSAGLVNLYGCKPEPAIHHLERAMRLSPLDPWMGSFLMGIAFAHQMAGRLEEAVNFGRAATRAMPCFGAPRRVVVASLAMLGRMDEARAAAAELRRTCPAAYRVFAERVYAQNPDKAYANRIIAAYRAVGMPE